MTFMPVHYSSEKQDWETPQELFDLLDREFHFDIDVAATPTNAKCPIFFTPYEDGLVQDWEDEVCWLNPPYGRTIQHWMEKAYRESKKRAKVVCLVPARIDTQWWYDYCTQGEIRFLKGRLTFSGYGTAPFPSAIVIFHPRNRIVRMRSARWWDWRKDEWR
jgi:site-specific DNA-methyltransferase (adenine-specific)